MVGFSAAVINEVSHGLLVTISLIHCCTALWHPCSYRHHSVHLSSWHAASAAQLQASTWSITTRILLQAITGQTLWRQLAAAPFAYLVAYSLVIVGALLNRC